MNTETKPKTKEKRITIWGNPETPLQSQWGTVTYKTWCQNEMMRINALGGNASVVERDGMIAVSRQFKR